MKSIEGKLYCLLANTFSLDDIVNIAVPRSNMSQCFALKYGSIGDEVRGNPITVYYPIPDDALPFGFTSAAFAGLAYHPRVHRSRGCGRLLHSLDLDENASFSHMLAWMMSQ
jgi:hypothetical protein